MSQNGTIWQHSNAEQQPQQELRPTAPSWLPPPPPPMGGTRMMRGTQQHPQQPAEVTAAIGYSNDGAVAWGAVNSHNNASLLASSWFCQWRAAAAATSSSSLESAAATTTTATVHDSHAGLLFRIILEPSLSFSAFRSRRSRIVPRATGLDDPSRILR